MKIGGHHFGHHHHRHHGHSLPSGPLLLGLAMLMGLWGVYDGFVTARLYFYGQRATGIVISRDEARDDTRLRVLDAECPVYGDQGRIGRGVPVVFPHGRPRDCMVRRPSAFKWSAGATLLGAGGLAFALMGMRAVSERGKKAERA